MQIKVAPSAGFCYGVLRATDMAYKAASSKKGEERVVTLGPIIHNPQVVKGLQEKGVDVVNESSKVPAGARVILRSHGVVKEDIELLKAKGCSFVEATCPFVKKVHKAVKKLTRTCDMVVVVGDENHPEVKAILSFTKGSAHVVSAPDSVDALPRVRRVGLVAQTTLPLKIWKDVVERCRKKYASVEAVNTICNATTVRQREAMELARQVDAMLVIGGNDSANTKRLVQLCRQILPRNTYHVEGIDDVPLEQIKDLDTIGVTAGASTPSWVIEQVVDRLKTLS